jgi:hypothetical protein
MHDSSFERGTHHASLDKKVEKSTAFEQFCGCSKKIDTSGPVQKIHHRKLHSTGFLEPLRFKKRLIAQMKAYYYNS